MSYVTIRDALKARLATIDGLTVLDYEPRALHQSPAVYITLDGWRRSTTGQVTAMTYRINCRLCVVWQDNETAEAELAPFVNAIPAAIDLDRRLGGTIDSGQAEPTDASAEYAEIGGTLYRVLNIYVEALEKGAFKGGI